MRFISVYGQIRFALHAATFMQNSLTLCSCVVNSVADPGSGACLTPWRPLDPGSGIRDG
jgi:hypothetical protein